MSELQLPDIDTIEQWLKRMGQVCYLCGQCPGLHLEAVQSEEGVLDARLLMEPEGVLLSVELEIRPSILLGMNAELSYLNMGFPTIKAFLDVVDEGIPRLVLCDTLMTGAGVSYEQFAHFVTASLEQIHKIITDCQQQGYLMGDQMGAPLGEGDGAGKFH